MAYRLLAKRISNSLFHTIDNEDCYEVILYGLEIAISTFVNMILVVTLAFVLHIPLETLVYCLFFMPLRIFAGGAHAKSQGRCIGLFLICELVSIFIGTQVSTVFVQYVLIFGLLPLSVLVCILYAAKAKKTREEIRNRHRRISLVIILVDSILITVGTVLSNSLLHYAVVAVLAVFCQSMALLPLWNRLAKSQD